MPDRHWMEKWKWRHDDDGSTLVRKKDGREATGWTHAMEIEAQEKGITTNQLVTDQRYNMVPLSEVYPDDVRVDEPIRLGERREQQEVKSYAERITNLSDPPPAEDEPRYAYDPTHEGQKSRGMFCLGWVFAVAAILIVLTVGGIASAAVLALAFFAGAAMTHYIVKD